VQGAPGVAKVGFALSRKTVNKRKETILRKRKGTVLRGIVTGTFATEDERTGFISR
jgi:hypothetical protein